SRTRAPAACWRWLRISGWIPSRPCIALPSIIRGCWMIRPAANTPISVPCCNTAWKRCASTGRPCPDVNGADMAVKQLHPQGHFPAPGIFRRVASAFYDMMLCLAMLMVLTLVYQQVVLRMIYGAETLEAMSNAGQLDRDPLLTVLMVLAIYGFFMLFWTLRGQTL